MSEYNPVKGIEGFSSSDIQKEDTVERRSVEAKHSDAFKEMLKRKDAGRSDHTAEEKKYTSSIQVDAPISTFIEGIATPSIQPNVITDPPTMNKVAPIEGNYAALNELIGLLVQRITTVSLDQHKEIRLTLQDHILAGTEVRITAENQHLAVQFLTSSGNVNQWLEHRKSTLQANLEAELNKKLDRQVNIFVSITSDEEKQEERHYP